MNRFRTFRLRTLLAIITVACLLFAVRQHIRRYQLLAHEHHYLALSHGYHAIEIYMARFDHPPHATTPDFIQQLIVRKRFG